MILRWEGQKRTDFKVVVVGQRILNSVYQGRSSEDQIRHLIHGRLDRGAVVLGEGLECDVARGIIGSIELLKVGLHLGEATEATPLPVGHDVGAENAIPGLLECGVLIAEEAPELGAGALQHGQPVDGGVDVDTLAFYDIDLGVAGLAAGLGEGVCVGLAVDFHALPAVGHDVNVRRVDVAILLDEVCAQN